MHSNNREDEYLVMFSSVPEHYGILRILRLIREYKMIQLHYIWTKMDHFCLKSCFIWSYNLYHKSSAVTVCILGVISVNKLL